MWHTDFASVLLVTVTEF